MPKLLFILMLFTLASPLVADPLNPKRPHLKNLLKDSDEKFREYVFPYLVTQYAVVSDESVSGLVKSLRKRLQQKKAPLKGRFGKSGSAKITSKSIPLPADVKKGKQLKGIKECSAKYCKMKLHTSKEKPVMGNAKDKVNAYHELVMERVRRFRNKRFLTGYEKVWDNKAAANKMVEIMRFLKYDYPKCEKFLRKALWSGSKSGCQPKDSFYRDEVVMMNLDRLQPIWRVSEVFEFKENNKHLFYELHVYTNHYFDASARVYEVFSLKPKKNLIVITDIMDIDTLKMSAMARSLYKNQMWDAVYQLQRKDIKAID